MRKEGKRELNVSMTNEWPSMINGLRILNVYEKKWGGEYEIKYHLY
jgi:hypothetical protein